MIALIISIILWLGGIADLENRNPELIEDYKIEYADPNGAGQTSVAEQETIGL